MTFEREATVYRGPIRESVVIAGGKSIRLVRPGDPDRLLDDPEVAALNAVDDYMPYWAYLWPGSFLLADAIVRGNWPERTRTLELGCGLGLPGLVAVREGLSVEFTDYDRAPLAFVERSVASNHFDPNLATLDVLDWGHPTKGRFDLILGADITYERRLVPLVASVVAAKLEPDGVALVSDPNRVASQGFGEAIRSVGLKFEAAPVEANADDFGPVRGTIYRIWKPKSFSHG